MPKSQQHQKVLLILQRNQKQKDSNTLKLKKYEKNEFTQKFICNSICFRC